MRNDEFKAMKVNEIYLDTIRDLCFLVMKTGYKKHTVIYETEFNKVSIDKDTIDRVIIPSSIIARDVRKQIVDTYKKRSEGKKNSFGNIIINIQSIKDYTLEEIVNFYPENYSKKKVYFDDNLVPYVEILRSFWRLVRHYDLKKSKKYWNRIKQGKQGEKIRPKNKIDWDRNDYISYIKEKGYIDCIKGTEHLTTIKTKLKEYEINLKKKRFRK